MVQNLYFQNFSCDSKPSCDSQPYVSVLYMFLVWHVNKYDFASYRAIYMENAPSLSLSLIVWNVMSDHVHHTGYMDAWHN
jgi:hypothetical protein